MTRAAVWIVSAVLACGQSAKFDVASIHPHTGEFGGLSTQNGTFRAIMTRVKWLIMGAYELQEFQVSGGPSWVATDYYDVVAKAENGASGKEMNQMVRSLLEDRFKLAFHWEAREQPIYHLVVAKGGVKMKRSADDADPTQSMSGGRVMTMTAKAMDVPTLVYFLSNPAGHPVLDKTGLEGKFDLQLQWTSDPNLTEYPTIQVAIQEQLGLRLETHKGPVQILVIDHVERPTEN